MNNQALKLTRWQRVLTKTSSLHRFSSERAVKSYQLPRAPSKEFISPRLYVYRFFSTTTKQDNLVLKPWKTQMVESFGDYRNEIHLEEQIGGPLYENQKSLPQLPIPSIQDTIQRFLPTALPLAKTNEEAVALKAACQAFPDQAKHLQERLIDRKDEEMKDSSWLQLWWNQLAYLQFRDSVVINVSYFFHFNDDPTIDDTIGSQANVQRAAAMLYATAEFRKQVVSGELSAEKVGKKQTPLCSTAYKYMFHACRIPRSVQDSYCIYDPSRYTHCIVARKGHFFAMEIVDPDSGGPLPLSALEAQLKQCVELADEIPSSTSRPKLGLLTTSNRENWAEARDKLLQVGGVEMEMALTKLESGAILVNLDDESPVSRQECGELFLSGGLASGENRWFDKSIQVMVQNNGKAGLCGEHSMMDGMPLVNYASYITNTTYANAKARSKDGDGSEAPQVQDIFAAVTEKMDQSILNELESKAREEFRELITSQSNEDQSFHGYGSDFIKKAGHSPDAFVQVAMQLATYRLFGEQVGTYEATQVRPFLHGRTETTRAVSLESEAFVKKMGSKPKMDEDDPEIRKCKLELLQKASAAHSQYTGVAAQAQGVDRHFFGLSMLVGDGEKTPDLLVDPVFARSKRWRLSTSHLTHPNFMNWGFGEVVSDGVGIAYSILPRSCVFNVTALKETGWTSKLSQLLEEALLEIQRLIEMDQPPVSKL